jgi:hypothetical protein
VVTAFCIGCPHSSRTTHNPLGLFLTPAAVPDGRIVRFKL